MSKYPYLKAANPNTIGVVRASFPRLAEPSAMNNGPLKYSVQLLVPKDNEELVEAIRNQLDAAVDKGVEDRKFTKAAVRSANFQYAMRDGDEMDTDKYPEREGHYVINAKQNADPSAWTNANGVVSAVREDKSRPKVYNRSGQEIDPRDIESGDWVVVNLSTFAFNNQSKGVSVSLQSLMLWDKGEPLSGGGAPPKEEAFGDLFTPVDEQADVLSGSDEEDLESML